MEELLRDRILWTKEKFKEKEEVAVENTEGITSRPNTSNNDLKNESDKNNVREEDVKETIPEEIDAVQAIKNKVVGLYFAANWCIPCQEFTTLLKETYAELKERASPFEIVFISFDKKLDDMKGFYNESHGDWLAVPFKDQVVDSLKSMYKITVIPKLIVVRDNGTVITEKGRKDIQDKGIICFRGWLQKANLSKPKPPEEAEADKENEQSKKDKDKTVTFKEKD